jgi:hypothetical protein
MAGAMTVEQFILAHQSVAALILCISGICQARFCGSFVLKTACEAQILLAKSGIFNPLNS